MVIVLPLHVLRNVIFFTFFPSSSQLTVSVLRISVLSINSCKSAEFGNDFSAQVIPYSMRYKQVHHHKGDSGNATRKQLQMHRWIAPQGGQAVSPFAGNAS